MENIILLYKWQCSFPFPTALPKHLTKVSWPIGIDGIWLLGLIFVFILCLTSCKAAGGGMIGCIWFQSQTAMFSAVLTCYVNMSSFVKARNFTH